MKTSVEVAEELQVTPRTIQRWCAALGFKKVGRDYILTPDQVKLIKERYYPGPGRPPKDGNE